MLLLTIHVLFTMDDPVQPVCIRVVSSCILGTLFAESIVLQNATDAGNHCFGRKFARRVG